MFLCYENVVQVCFNQNGQVSYIKAALIQMCFFFVFTDRMSEGDSVGESIHGKPSVVGAFFTRIGQVTWHNPQTTSLSLIIIKDMFGA